MTHKELGILLLVAAAMMAVVGLLLLSGAFGWFGRLPGDLRLEGERIKVWLPLGSMLVLSILLTLVINLVRRLLEK